MNDPKEILALEDKRYAAMLANDTATLESLFHDDLLYTHSSAVSDTKPSYLAALRAGKVRYRKASRPEQKVSFAGDCAIVRGRAEIEAEIDGKPVSLNVKFLLAWAKTPAGWKLHSWQSTRVP